MTDLQVRTMRSQTSITHTLAFTLIELLVVVTIIVVLLALLTPALDKAIYAAEKVDCLNRQRILMNGCLFYANDHKKFVPPNKIRGRGSASAYDIRQWFDDNGVVTPNAINTGAGSVRSPYLQLGLLPENDYLPRQNLGKLMHCPVMDNLSNPGTAFGSGVGKYAGVGMDVETEYGVGASWYYDESAAGLRMIIGYNYRGSSWENSGHPLMRTSDLTSDHLMTVDLPDQRFVGPPVAPGIITEANQEDLRKFTHPDGYGRSFADGHTSFRDDRDFEVAWQIYRRSGGWGDMSGDRAGFIANVAEAIYTQYMNRD
jgi:competence protein ComGC